MTEFRLDGMVLETERLDADGTWLLVGNEFCVSLVGDTIIGTVEGRAFTLQLRPDNTIPASIWVYER